jgi:hypothetical protein
MHLPMRWLHKQALWLCEKWNWMHEQLPLQWQV